MEKYVCGSYIPADGINAVQLEQIDFCKITHVFIAFSTLNMRGEMYVPTVSDGVAQGICKIQAEIQKQNADSRVLLSIGGAQADYFCPAVRTDENRKAFAEKCIELCEEFSLDGIDLDWEFPGLPHCGVTACENCVHDFTLLCRELRAILGEKLLTSAMGSDHWNRLENSELKNLLDYVCVMSYDMDNEKHSSMPLTVSAMQGWASVGYVKEKILLGVPFYSRCLNEKYNWTGYNILVKKVLNGEAEFYSEPDQEYIKIGDELLSVDTKASIAEKVDYIKKEGFGGIFCWQELTDHNGELRNAMSEILKQ